MNNKANVFFGAAVAIFIYIAGVLFIPFITDDITTSRTSLDCSNTSISGGTKLTCLNIGLVAPYLIWFFVSLLFGFLAGSTT